MSTKISALSAGTTIAGTEVFPGVQSAATVKFTFAQVATYLGISNPANGSALALASNKTLTVNNSLTLAGTDATTLTFPTTSATIARTDAAQTFTGLQTFGTAGISLGTSTIANTAADAVNIYDGTNGQKIKLYRTRTDANNGSWLELDANGNGNTYIGSNKNGTGGNSDLFIILNGTVFYAFASSNSGFTPGSDAARDLGGATFRWRDFYVSRDFYTPGGTQAIFRSAATITSGAGAQSGTLTNAPAAGNPTSWIPINDNGTTRYIPAW